MLCYVGAYFVSFGTPSNSQNEQHRNFDESPLFIAHLSNLSKALLLRVGAYTACPYSGG